MGRLSENQESIINKIRTLKTTHKAIGKASMLQKAAMAEVAVGLSIQVLEHLAIEVIPSGK